MNISIVTIGRPKLPFAAAGFDVYITRLRSFHKVEVVHVDDNRKSSQKMISIIDKHRGARCVLLDEGGKQYTSKELAMTLEDMAMDREGSLLLLIGGPDGHDQCVRDIVPECWSLSLLTLPHDMAMLFLGEALYRSSTISAGHPYHRL
jgi:23S rRNA (pseudouridine1915-N3)-methyltransferase